MKKCSDQGFTSKPVQTLVQFNLLFNYFGRELLCKPRILL